MNAIKAIFLLLVTLANLACLEDGVIESLNRISEKPVVNEPQKQDEQKNDSEVEGAGFVNEQTSTSVSAEPSTEPVQDSSSVSQNTDTATYPDSVPTPLAPQPSGNNGTTTPSTPTTGTSTTAGNPSLMLNLDNAELLMLLDQPGNNFVKYTENGYANILEFTNPDLGTNNLIRLITNQITPISNFAVRDFFLGPNDDIVVYFDMPVRINELDDPCLIIYFDLLNISSQCLPSSRVGRRNDLRVKFDQIGHVYYAPVFDPVITRSNLLTRQHTQLAIPASDRVTAWEPHAGGDLYISGIFDQRLVTLSSYSYLKKIALNGVVTDVIPNTYHVVQLEFLDKDTMALFGYNANSFIVPLIPSNTLIIDLNDTNPLVNATIPYPITSTPGPLTLPLRADLNTLEYSDAGDAFVISRNTVSCLYPCIPYDFNLGLDIVNEFHISGNLLYASGNVGANVQIIKKEIYEDDIDPVNVLQNIEPTQILNFQVNGSDLYYNGIRYSDNRTVLGWIDTNTFKHEILDEDVLIEKMQTLHPYWNGSFED